MPPRCFQPPHWRQSWEVFFVDQAFPSLLLRPHFPMRNLLPAHARLRAAQKPHLRRQDLLPRSFRRLTQRTTGTRGAIRLARCLVHRQRDSCYQCYLTAGVHGKSDSAAPVAPRGQHGLFRERQLPTLGAGLEPGPKPEGPPPRRLWRQGCGRDRVRRDSPLVVSIAPTARSCGCRYPAAADSSGCETSVYVECKRCLTGSS